MKRFRLFITLFVSVLVIVLALKSVQAQSGNQSDVTGPDPQEIVTPDSNDGGAGAVERPEVDRETFEDIFDGASVEQQVELFEELQAVEFGGQLNLDLFGSVASSQDIANTLRDLSRLTNKKAALIYVVSLKDKLELLLIVPNNPPIRQVIPAANRRVVQKAAQEFRTSITNRILTNYLPPAKQLYQWIVAPFEQVLQANQIDTLIFSMDAGLRTIPVAALHNGQQFLIEQYSVAIIPSFSLTDTRYLPITNSQILAMGISKGIEGQTPLPAVAVEIPTLANELWPGQAFLNQASTIENLKSLSRQHFGIIHLATHAEFKPGKISNSYIQFWNTKLRLDQLRKLSQELQWNAAPKVEMLVLSACRTALGDEQAELGFAGLAVQAGVKTALGSLWYVSDQGSLALMTKFYEQLKSAPIKTEALRQAQLAMLKGQVRIEGGQLRLSEVNRVPLPPELARMGDIILSHPYFWSAFTIIGNWN
ncbi:MAG: CHAT domain-containing protein [Aphanothece sp. CMT-3BRIN-NPC111]|nr:CHAT domain-containing protein [Aphanothece sp. CMT-3BRIN-NPC111]